MLVEDLRYSQLHTELLSLAWTRELESPSMFAPGLRLFLHKLAALEAHQEEENPHIHPKWHSQGTSSISSWANLP